MALEVIPLTAATVRPALDKDNHTKNKFYFYITEVPGKSYQSYVFCCHTGTERDKWVEKISYMSDMATNLDTLQCHSEELKKKLFTATTLLKMNVGEKLLENMLSGRYKIGTRKYREVRQHLDDYFIIWADVMSKKLDVHKELLNRDETNQSTNRSDSENSEELDSRNLLLRKVIATMGHVRRESVVSASHGTI